MVCLSAELNMKVLCIIPARMNSTRLPRKPLALIGDKPLILHTYESAKKCSRLDKIIVATDHSHIQDIICSAGGHCMMTPQDLKTGTDRVAYVAAKEDCDVVINLQGDEPFIDANDLEKLVSSFSTDPSLKMSTLASKLDWEQDYHSPDLVKVICDQKNYALYFSRSPIPYLREQNSDRETIPVYKHMGLYAFRKEYLLEFSKLAQTPLEKIEALEQLRALENKVAIKVEITNNRSLEVNTPQELEEAQKYWSSMLEKKIPH